MAKDYYDILGVDKGASEDDIKRAFRRAAHQHHPDKAGGDAEKFKEINEAYQVLSNKEKRSQYDQFGQTLEQAQAQGGFGGGFGRGPGGGMGGFPFGAGFGGGFGPGGATTFTTEDLGEIIGDLFGMRRSRSRRPSRRGDDVEMTLLVDFTEAAFGAKKEIQVSRLGVCTACHGTGDKKGKLTKCLTCEGQGKVREVRQTILGTIAQERICGSCHGDGQIPANPCAECSGQGRRRHSEKLAVEVPAGIHEGQIIRLTGQGDAGRRGGEAGDLLTVIEVAPSEKFVRDGINVKTRLELDYPQLVLGDKVELDGLEGKLEMQIPAGTAPGKVVRLRGEGVPQLNSTRRGDLFVEIGLATPKRVSPEERELLEKLASLRGRQLTKRKRRGLFR